MCDICTLQTVSKNSLKEPYDKTLSYVGSVRRRKIHRNRTKGEKRKLKDGVRDAEWKAIELKKQKSQKQLRRDLRDLFETQIQTFVDRLKSKVGLKALYFAKSNTKQPDVFPNIVDILINWAEWFERTKDTARPGVENIAEDGFETALQRIGSEGPDFTSRDPQVATTLEEILDQTARTQDSFRDVAARTIQKGLTEGDDMPDLVRRVARKTQEQVGFRLDRIVQTAGNGAFERGQRTAFRKAGIEIIDWLTQRDARVRSPVAGDLWDHRSADRQEVQIDQKFRLTGKGGRAEELWHPTDPNGSPGNTIYCRCSVTPVE